MILGRLGAISKSGKKPKGAKGAPQLLYNLQHSSRSIPVPEKAYIFTVASSSSTEFSKVVK